MISRAVGRRLTQLRAEEDAAADAACF
jgi:hypothetical protein